LVRLSVESVFLVNFLLDALTIAATIRHRVRLRPARILAASALGALAASYLAVAGAGSVFRVAFALLIAPVMVRVAAGRTGLRTLLGLSAALISVSAFMAGIMGSLSGISFWASLIACASSAVVAGMALGLRRRSLDTWEAWIELHYRGMRMRFRALVDTGNHLTEPLSGLPVMLVSRDAIWKALPDSFSPGNALETLPRGFRLVSYGGVGGAGELGCFMPDELTVDTGRGERPMGDVWIAVYPGKLPGGAVALAPPTFLNS
jgi:stage II sporulation protein GA (sporulation sigma-E factor processing peptidase)